MDQTLKIIKVSHAKMGVEAFHPPESSSTVNNNNGYLGDRKITSTIKELEKVVVIIPAQSLFSSPMKPVKTKWYLVYGSRL